MKREKRFASLRFTAQAVGLIAILICLGTRAARAQGQELPKYDFRAIHYDVQAALRPADQSLAAEAKVELVAKTASRTILVQLHPDLHVESVRLAIDGRKLDFLRDSFKTRRHTARSV